MENIQHNELEEIIDFHTTCLEKGLWELNVRRRHLLFNEADQSIEYVSERIDVDNEVMIDMFLGFISKVERYRKKYHPQCNHRCYEKTAFEKALDGKYLKEEKIPEPA